MAGAGGLSEEGGTGTCSEYLQRCLWRKNGSKCLGSAGQRGSEPFGPWRVSDSGRPGRGDSLAGARAGRGACWWGA